MAKTKPKAKYQPTEKERAQVLRSLDRMDNAPTTPGIKMELVDGIPQLSIDHPDNNVGTMLQMEALGISEIEFLSGLISQMFNAGTQGQPKNAEGLNFMLKGVAGMQPRDHIEAMLCSQMVAVHNATMTFARRLAHVDNIPQQDSAERAFNKLARTFAKQDEALNRHRGKGQQKVTVEHVHVHVHDGGQAIVGNVEQGGGANSKSEDRAHAKRVAHAQEPEMRCENEEREAVPIASG